MEYSILVDGGDLTLDEKVDCRKIIDGSIYLGRFLNSESKVSNPIRLRVRAYYYSNIGALVMLRNIEGDTRLDHRSCVVAWEGGLVVHMEVDRFLSESLHWSAVRIRDADLLGGRFSKDRFDPASSLEGIFNPPEPRMPTPMSATPIPELRGSES